MNKYLLNTPVVITGYRGDNVARVVEIVEEKKELLLVKCLMRSSIGKTVYRSYFKKYIDGVMEAKTC